MIDPKLVVCAVGSVVAHFAIERGLERLPRYTPPVPPHTIEIRVTAPEPPPEPPKPEEKPPEPKPQPAEAPRPHPVHAPQVAAVPKDTPPPEHPPVTSDTSDQPVFGVTMESTSVGGTGPAMPVGNATRVAPGTGSGAVAVKPLAEPVAAFEATKMPLPQGRCTGKYTDDAKTAGVEGTVVLDLIVGEDGKVRDIVVVQGLDHGLTESAKAALRACQFTPGEKDGKPVPVKIRGFKIHFVLSDAE